jgi:hypothetical protein
MSGQMLLSEKPVLFGLSSPYRTHSDDNTVDNFRFTEIFTTTKILLRRDRVDVNNPKRFLFYIYEQDAKSSYFRKKIVHESVVNIYENVSDQSDAIRTDSWPKLNNPSNK